jgi:hypothetical protein
MAMGRQERKESVAGAPGGAGGPPPGTTPQAVSAPSAAAPAPSPVTSVRRVGPPPVARGALRDPGDSGASRGSGDSADDEASLAVFMALSYLPACLWERTVVPAPYAGRPARR